MERLTNSEHSNEQRRDYEKRLRQGYPRNIPEERFLKLAHYEDLEEQGRLIELPCKMGDTVYVLAECKNIQPQLDGTLYSPDGSPGTATGYYCPYEDDCPHTDFSDDCDKCKDITAVFEDEVTSVIVDDLGVQLFTDTCGVSGYLGDYIFLTKEEAEKKLKEMESE